MSKDNPSMKIIFVYTEILAIVIIKLKCTICKNSLYIFDYLYVKIIIMPLISALLNNGLPKPITWVKACLARELKVACSILAHGSLTRWDRWRSRVNPSGTIWSIVT